MRDRRCGWKRYNRSPKQLRTQTPTGFGPSADAIDPCFKILRLKNPARWILEGDIKGFFDTISCSWIEAHIPMNQRVLSKWLRSGFSDRGALFPTEAGDQ